MKVHVINFSFFFRLTMCVNIGKSGIITTDINWYEWIPIDQPSLLFEFVLNVEFPTSACCPIVHLRQNHTNQCVEPNCCFDSITVQKLQALYKTKYFQLQRNDIQGRSTFVTCNVALDHHVCQVKMKRLNYVPKIPWLDFGYPCDERNNSLKGLKFSVSNMLIKNSTTCEPVPKNTPPINCGQYYSHTTFPNVFGHFSTFEILETIDMMRTIVHSNRIPCHKHLFYMICQTFFPRCPEPNKLNSGNDSTYEVSSVVPLCQEMCHDFKRACAIDFLPMVDHFDCQAIPYHRRSTNCVYMEVFCTNPPTQSIGGPDTYPVDSTLEYSCPFLMMPVQNNPNVTCTFSGQWTETPECTIATGVKVFTITAFTTIILTFYCWFHKRHTYYDYECNFVKRNRKYDAFVQYSDSGKDEDFVRNALCPHLESEKHSQFRLFLHKRDFLAGTLIYYNVLRAIRNSNATIILLSQDYIDSSWCREEFEESMEEHRKDPAFKICVILMQPKEQLKRLSESMVKFIRTTNYIDRNDSKLWIKLTECLTKLQGKD